MVLGTKRLRLSAPRSAAQPLGARVLGGRCFTGRDPRLYPAAFGNGFGVSMLEGSFGGSAPASVRYRPLNVCKRYLAEVFDPPHVHIRGADGLSQGAHVPSSQVTCNSPRRPWINCRMLLALVSIIDSITSLPLLLRTAITTPSLCTSCRHT